MPFANPSARLVAAVLGLGLWLAAPVALAIEAPRGLLVTHAGDRELTWNDALKDLASADVAFLGEQHGDPATHRLELAVLQGLHEAVGPRLILSLEMFERDVQAVLDAYLQGRIPEAEFLAQSRPWPNYARDYRPLVEYAKAHGLPVLASNVPRRLASLVAKQGLDALNGLSAEERGWAASTVDCPKDRLWERFQETMRDHPGLEAAQIERMYVAQCLKDATMAESIALSAEARPGSVILHVNGAFHSDEGLGVPAQLRRLAPELKSRVATVLPVESRKAMPPAGLANLVFMVNREKSE
ncbi:hypothetical protein D3C86_406010 [compost metagenome]